MCNLKWIGDFKFKIIFPDSWLLCYSGCRIGANTERYNDRVLAACRNEDTGLVCETLTFTAPNAYITREYKYCRKRKFGRNFVVRVKRLHTHCAFQLNSIVKRTIIHALRSTVFLYSNARVCSQASLNWTDCDFYKYFLIFLCAVRIKVQYLVWNQPFTW